MVQLPSYLTISTKPSDTLESLISKWKPDRVGVLVDENTREFCLSKISIQDFITIEIKSGEENKTLATCEKVWATLTENVFTRKSLLINLGGGVIGDLGGFAASTYKRGIKFVNVPTTLLSQVDASIGGKLGVDLGDLKNHIGLFRDPDHVIVSPDFLKTLNRRELRSGFAEVIKHTLISNAKTWNSLIKVDFDQQNWDEIIPQSILIKNQVVTSDPLENGLRKILNFGHTLGHAVESHFLHTSNKLLHGEAIAIGMILESHLSMQKGWLTESQFLQIKNYIFSMFSLPNQLPNLDELNKFLLQDKKNDSSGINFSLLNGIGKCEYDVHVSDHLIEKSLSAY